MQICQVPDATCGTHRINRQLVLNYQMAQVVLTYKAPISLKRLPWLSTEYGGGFIAKQKINDAGKNMGWTYVPSLKKSSPKVIT